jgi:hypothetical protein
VPPVKDVGSMLSDTERLKIEGELKNWLSEMLEVDQKVRATIERVHAQGYHLLISHTTLGEIEVELVPMKSSPL